MSGLRLYNSLTRRLEEFVPLHEGELKMYACGVTVYDHIHIGHAMQAVVYDVIRAYFEYLGYKVTYVRNFTDVDDKIIKRSQEQGKDALELSNFFIEESFHDLHALKVHPADHEPKVSECIPEIVNYIQVLLDKGFAYEVGGEVFFDIDKFQQYGKLSNRKREDLINSEESTSKKNNNDFVLWKPRKDGEPYWDSPWSKGRPGWHIECSAMVSKYLGDEIDIHGGGMDLIFPHHENEIAQSEAYSGKPFARYWVHNGLIMINGVKMSKSLGNFLILKEALQKYFPDEIRYAILTHNYSSNIDFSEELFLNARKRLHYFYSTLALVNEYEPVAQGSVSIPKIISTLEEKFREYMSDNFNTSRVISELADVFKELNKILSARDLSISDKGHIFAVFSTQFTKISSVLRLFDDKPQEYLQRLKLLFLSEKGIDADYIEEQINKRQEAKRAKDFVTADQIKEQLSDYGISIKDLPDSVKWDINV